MNWTLLHKYLSDECSPEEMQRVEDWLHADERNQRFFDSLKKIWEVDPDDEMEVNAQAAWYSFQKKLSTQSTEMLEKINPVSLSSVPRFKTRYIRPAAERRHARTMAFALSAAAAVILALLFYWYVPTGTEAIHPSSAMQEIMTEKGQRTSFRLADGTHVQLNADSRLEIPARFMGTTREVYLEGEAYFEVAHNPDKPFVIHSEEAFTRVLGTKFGVRAYPEENRVQVAVAEGKVALGSAMQSARQNGQHITENQIGILAEGGEARVSDIANIEQYLGWKDGKLVFVDTPFREVIPQLERWFDIICTLEDEPSLGSLELTASFEGEHLTEVLNVIALSMDIVYEREGRDIIFRKH